MRGLWRRHGAPALGVYRLIMAVNRRFWVMTVFVALLLPLIVQGAFGQRLEADERARLLLGNVLFGALMISMRRTGIVLVEDRIFGHRDLLATANVSRGAYLLGSALDSLTLSVLPLFVLVVGVAFGGVDPPASWQWLPVYAAGVASMFALALLVGACLRSLPSAVLVTNLLLMGQFAFTPVVYPVARAPEALRPLVTHLPAALTAEAMAAGWHGEPLAVGALAELGIWTALLAGLGLRLFPWTDRA